MRIFLEGVLGVENDIKLLPHWLRHYLEMGIPSEQMLLTLHSPDKDSHQLKNARRVISRIAPNAIVDEWIGPFQNRGKYLRSMQMKIQHANIDDWIVPADADELHEFPLPIGEIVSRLKTGGKYAAIGAFRDRLSLNYSLADISETPALELQFPIKTRLSRYIARANDSKVMIHSMKVMPGSGGNHYIAFPELRRGEICEYGSGYQVHHYKWNSSLRRKLLSRTDPIKVREDESHSFWSDTSTRLFNFFFNDIKRFGFYPVYYFRAARTLISTAKARTMGSLAKAALFLITTTRRRRWFRLAPNSTISKIFESRDLRDRSVFEYGSRFFRHLSGHSSRITSSSWMFLCAERCASTTTSSAIWVPLGNNHEYERSVFTDAPHDLIVINEKPSGAIKYAGSCLSKDGVIMLNIHRIAPDVLEQLTADLIEQGFFCRIVNGWDLYELRSSYAILFRETNFLGLRPAEQVG